jgi:hypothetical protein
MGKLTSTLLFCFFSFISFAQIKIDKDKEIINSVCEKFMMKFRDGNISEAMQLLKDNSVMSHDAIDTLQVTVLEQVNTVFPSFGKTISYEFIIEKKVKNFIAKRFYILKFENYYLKFDFTLYNSGNDWTITNFNYNQDLIELLK